jgi:hypothetical protein
MKTSGAGFDGVLTSMGAIHQRGTWAIVPNQPAAICAQIRHSSRPVDNLLRQLRQSNVIVIASTDAAGIRLAPARRGASLSSVY